MSVEHAVETPLGYYHSDIPAVRFTSHDFIIGDLRETWFVHDGFLYQIMVHAPYEKLIDLWILEVAGRWRFVSP